MIDWVRLQPILSLPDSSKDEAERVEKVAVAMAEKYAGRPLEERDIVETVPVPPMGRVFLAAYPISSVTSITYNGEDIGYTVGDTQRGILQLLVNPVQDIYVEIRYRGGYSQIPADLEQAVIDIISWQLRRLTGDMIGTNQRTIEGGYSEGNEIQIPVSARNVLRHYKRWW